MSEICILAILSVWLYTPIPDGGLGYNPFQIGVTLTLFGVTGGIGAFSVSPILQERFGNVGAYRISASSLTIALLLLPVTNAFARWQGNSLNPAVFCCLFLLTLQNVFINVLFCLAMTLVNGSIENRASTGTLNGLAQTTAVRSTSCWLVLLSPIVVIRQSRWTLLSDFTLCFQRRARQQHGLLRPFLRNDRYEHYFLYSPRVGPTVHFEIAYFFDASLTLEHPSYACTPLDLVFYTKRLVQSPCTCIYPLPLVR